MTKTNFLNDDFNEEDDFDEDVEDMGDMDVDDDYGQNDNDLFRVEDDDENDDDKNDDNVIEEEKEGDDETVVISKSKFVLIKKLLENIKENNEKLSQIVSSCVGSEEETRISIGQMSDDNFDFNVKENKNNKEQETGRIIEGVFDGENMIGPDGKQYSVPANYASKSKLIEGDILKLTITGSGTFVYKQIGPIERKSIIGVLDQDENSNYSVRFEGNKWRVLTASVTYYKGKPGDEVVILVPKSGQSKWAAVDNIVRNS